MVTIISHEGHAKQSYSESPSSAGNMATAKKATEDEQGSGEFVSRIRN